MTSVSILRRGEDISRANVKTIDQMINLVVAVDKKFGIGKQGTLPWKLKSEFWYFSNLTKRGFHFIGNEFRLNPDLGNNSVIMGRKTFESIGKRPLKDRRNIIVSRTEQEIETASSLKSAIDLNKDANSQIFICGGKRLYEESISFPCRLFLTVVDGEYDCDTFFDCSEYLNGKELEITNEIFNELKQKYSVQYSKENGINENGTHYKIYHIEINP